MTKNLTTFLTQVGDHGEVIKLQHDRYNRLYVNDKAIVTETKLSCFERGLAILVSTAVIGDFFISLLSYLRKYL
jgi:hypothetical protein